MNNATQALTAAYAALDAAGLKTWANPRNAADVRIHDPRRRGSYLVLRAVEWDGKIRVEINGTDSTSCSGAHKSAVRAVLESL